MCGFLFINDKNLNIKLCDKSLKKIEYRGPDESKSLKIEDSYLGFNRLAIQDLTTNASQPMKLNEINNHDYILFNGEIYNFKELIINDNYLKKDFFFSRSDTEVILRLKKNYGFENMLRKIEGMFSFLIFNQKEKKVYLARDPFGQKPLYYFNQNNIFIASSEIKSIVEYVDNVEPDFFGSINPIFQMSLPPKNLTMFKNIKKLEKGHYLTYEIKTGKLETKKYFDSTKLIDEKEYIRRKDASINSCADELDELLTKSIERHTISDAKLGVSFSYGLDSAVISSKLAKNSPDKKNINLISFIPFVDNSEILDRENYDGIPINKIIERKDSSYLNSMPFTSYFSETSSNQSTALLSLVSKEANKMGIKVMLTGDAADELFGAYFHLKEYYYSNFFENKVIKKLKSYIDNNPLFSGLFGRSNEIYKTNYYLGNQSDSISQFSNMLLHGGDRTKEFLNIYNSYDFIKKESDRRYNSIVHDEVFSRLERQLIRSDNYSMPNSIENRTPFLDMKIVKFCLNTPASKNLGKFLNFKSEKKILRKLAKKIKVDKEKIKKKKNRHTSIKSKL